MADGDDDLKIEPEDAGVAFRTEMWMTDFLMKYWMVIAGVTVAFLVGVFIYGQMSNMYTAGQRRTTAAVADIESELPTDVFSMAQIKAGFNKNEELDVAQLKEAAAELVSTASNGDDTAAVEALLKAAELYRLADDVAGRRSALEKAAATSDGVLRYAAEAGLANLDIEQDKAEEALERFRKLAKDTDAYLAQQATLDLAGALEALGRDSEAVDAYDAYINKWSTATNIDEVRQRKDKAVARQGS